MNAAETLEILRELQRAGATHFKSQDFEVTLHARSSSVVKAPEADTGTVHQPDAKEGYSAPQENKEATEKLKNLIDTLKLDDASLLDRIFPAGAGG